MKNYESTCEKKDLSTVFVSTNEKELLLSLIKMKGIFEKLSKLKGQEYSEKKAVWNHLTGESPHSIFILKYQLENWEIEIQGETYAADLSAPNWLPHGEKIDNNIWSIKASTSTMNKLADFDIVVLKHILSATNNYKIRSDTKAIVELLSNKSYITEYYNLDYNSANIFEGKNMEDGFCVLTKLDTKENHENIVIAAVAVMEKLLDEINGRN